MESSDFVPDLYACQKPSFRGVKCTKNEFLYIFLQFGPGILPFLEFCIFLKSLILENLPCGKVIRLPPVEAKSEILQIEIEALCSYTSFVRAQQRPFEHWGHSMHTRQQIGG
jgi:hypothetical protein